jgi:hypothetical protein
MLKVSFLLLFFFLGQNNFGYLTPEEYFGDSYTDAISFFQKNSKSFKSFFSKYNIDHKLANAIVFPEVIRYNRFRDFAETTALELAYVQGGTSFADFSIGRFQMKPSFVEMLEFEFKSNSPIASTFSSIIFFKDTLSEHSIRLERVSRLKDQQWQLIYLAYFIHIAREKFKMDIAQNPNEELLILSSAYNLSLNASYSDLKRVASLKTFPYGRMGLGRFSYFDVADFYFQRSE